MRAATPPDEARRRFAEETDVSADLGRAPDAAKRMATIHAKHQAALNGLPASGKRPSEQHKDKGARTAEV